MKEIFEKANFVQRCLADDKVCVCVFLRGGGGGGGGGTQIQDQKLVFKPNYHLMLVKIIAECSKGSNISTFIKPPFVIKIFVLSIFEWPLKTGFTVAFAL